MNYIKTVVKEVNNKCVIVESNNVGYQVYVANPQLFKVESEYRLFIHQEQRLDKNNKITSNLFGFLDKKELDFFCFLMQANGVGSKIAINILSNDILEIFNLIKQNDVLGLSQFKGMNTRLANAIIAESNKTRKNNKLLCEINGTSESNQNYHMYQEIKEALREIGYQKSDIEECMSELKKQNQKLENLDDAISECIKIIISSKTNEHKCNI